MTFTTVMRVGTGEVRSFRQWIEFTGRDHIHHRLESLRIGRVGVVLIIYTVTIWLGLSALTLKNTSGINALLQVWTVGDHFPASRILYGFCQSAIHCHCRWCAR
jgi:UDP-GlcNAc:undecaprenyl-phosphate GlcNAc-1-phosphate transferase